MKIAFKSTLVSLILVGFAEVEAINMNNGFIDIAKVRDDTSYSWDSVAQTYSYAKTYSEGIDKDELIKPNQQRHPYPVGVIDDGSDDDKVLHLNTNSEKKGKADKPLKYMDV